MKQAQATNKFELAGPAHGGEEHQDQIQRCCVQQEHHNPICAVQSSNDLTKLFHCRIYHTNLNYIVKELQGIAGKVNGTATCFPESKCLIQPWSFFH